MFHPTKSWVYFCLILWYPVFGIGSSLTLIATLGLAVAVNMFVCWILHCVGIAPESNLSLLLRVLLAVFIMYSAFKAFWPIEVINELIQESYPKAITNNDLRPAASPQVSIDSEDSKKPIIYSAIIEVFPEIKPKFSRWTNYEEFEIKVDDTDIDLAIADIKKRYGEWKDVNREARLDDQVIIDFTGKIDGEEFEGNSSQDFKLVLGSNSMIPGFEDNIIGKKPSKFSIECTFPDDYFKKDLAGVAAEFEINLKAVQQITEAKVDKDLFEKLQMEIKDKND